MMKVVVDTNIVFSAILNANGLIGELLFNSDQKFNFYSSELMTDELIRYREKLQKLSSMTLENVDHSIAQVLKNIDLISTDAISELYWKQAYDLTRDVDEDDTPFVATALGIGGLIWTGDKKLIAGLRAKNYLNIYSTAELFELTN